MSFQQYISCINTFLILTCCMSHMQDNSGAQLQNNFLIYSRYPTLWILSNILYIFMYILKSFHEEHQHPFILVSFTLRHLPFQSPGNVFLINAFNMLSKHVIWDVWDVTNTFLSDYPPSWKPNRNIYFLIDIQIRKSSRLHLPSLQKQKSSQRRKEMHF